MVRVSYGIHNVVVVVVGVETRKVEIEKLEIEKLGILPVFRVESVGPNGVAQKLGAAIKIRDLAQVRALRLQPAGNVDMVL